jgi:hypothetical protein
MEILICVLNKETRVINNVSTVVTNMPVQKYANGKNISRTPLFRQRNSVHAFRGYGYTTFSAY